MLMLVAAAVGLEGCCTVGTNDPKVREPVVVPNAVDVVEDQTHPLPSPNVALSAELTHRLLQALFVEPPLQITAAVGRVFNENLTEGNPLSGAPERFAARCAGVEVIGFDSPDPSPLLQRPGVRAGLAVAEPAK